MRYYIALLILGFGILFSGCKTVDVSAGSRTASAKTDTVRDDTHEDGELTKRELRIINNDLNGPEYYGFLISDYEEPKYIDWNEVFYNGAGLKQPRLTKAVEDAYLAKTGEEEIFTDLTILAADDVEDFVKKTTGLSYSKMRNPLDWVYLKKQDLYLFEHGDTNQVQVDVISGDVEDGVFTVRYLHNNWWGDDADCEYEVCFTKNGDDYCFISNTPDMKTKGAGEYIFPDSDSRNLKGEELSGLDKETLRIGRNEIYARHGRKFKDSSLQSYFNGKSWYEESDASDSKIENSLNQYEKNNIRLIQSYENRAPASGRNSQTSKTPASKKAAAGYTDSKLCKMAQDYYERHYGFRPPVAEVDSTDGDDVTIHLYEDMGDHTATSAWYVIDRNTAKGYDEIFGDRIDLTK